MRSTIPGRIDVFDGTILGLLEGHVLHPHFVEQVLDLACGNTATVEREDIEQRMAECEKRIRNLSGAIEQLGPEDTPEEFIDRIKVLKAERTTLGRRLAAIEAPADRARLREALEPRCADWRQRLRADHPDEARFVVRQLIGPITLWEEAPVPESLRGCVVPLSTRRPRARHVPARTISASRIAGFPP